MVTPTIDARGRAHDPWTGRFVPTERMTDEELAEWWWWNGGMEWDDDMKADGWAVTEPEYYDCTGDGIITAICERRWSPAPKEYVPSALWDAGTPNTSIIVFGATSRRSA